MFLDNLSQFNLLHQNVLIFKEFGVSVSGDAKLALHHEKQLLI